jgi:hypothetical protein
LKYKSTFKEFKVEELLQDTLPTYFIYRDIEQVLKIDCQSFITDEKFIEGIPSFMIDKT